MTNNEIDKLLQVHLVNRQVVGDAMNSDVSLLKLMHFFYAFPIYILMIDITAKDESDSFNSLNFINSTNEQCQQLSKENWE